MGENQYVVFNLQNEEYAIDIKKISEIDRLKEIKITKVPRVPYFVEGIINLRGDVVPIVNLRKKFNVEYKDIDKETRIIIVIIGSKMIGILVDTVSKVVAFHEDEIIPPPEEIKNNCSYISGVGKKDQRILFILDIDKALNLECEDTMKIV